MMKSSNEVPVVTEVPVVPVVTEVTEANTGSSTADASSLMLMNKDLPSSSSSSPSPSFFGRQLELDRLHSLYSCIMQSGEQQSGAGTNNDNNNGAKKKLALIWGASGSGKSGLVEQFVSELAAQPQQQQQPHKSKTAPLPPVYALRGKCNQAATTTSVTGTNTGTTTTSSASKRGIPASTNTGTTTTSSASKRGIPANTNTNTNTTINANHANPLLAISHIFQDLAQQLQQGPLIELKRIQACITEALSPEVIPFLVSVMPALSSVLLVSQTAQENEEEASVRSFSTNSPSSFNINNGADDSEQKWNKLQYIFVNLIKAIATTERPLIIFLDDLQWSSQISLDLIARIVSDTTIHNLMVVGTIRQEIDDSAALLPLDEDSPLVPFLQSHKRAMDEIHLQNLSPYDMIPWIAQLLNRDHQETVDDNNNDDNDNNDDNIEQFAFKLYAKTRGNVLFTLQAMEELKRMEMLVYNTTSKQWDIRALEPDEDLPLSDDIVKVVITRLERLSKPMQSTLSIASLLGSTFSLPILGMVIDRERTHQTGLETSCCLPTKQTLPQMLEQAVFEGLLTNSIGGAKYSFAHDRIQQAAMEMLDGRIGDGVLVRARIGMNLYLAWKKSNEATSTAANKAQIDHSLHSAVQEPADEQPIHIDDTLLFIGANHINSSYNQQTDQCEHMLVAIMNLEVGERAAQIASFGSASSYFTAAYEAVQRLDLDNNTWQDHYDLTLRLTKARADVELALGRYELGEKLSKEVFENSKTIDDQLSSCLPFSKALGRQGRHVEACKFSRDILQKLGEYPSRFQLIYILKNLAKMKSILKHKTNQDILDLPSKVDLRKIYAAKLLNEVCGRSFVTQDWVGLIVSILKQLEISFQDGVCAETAGAYSFYTSLLILSGDKKNAIRCGNVAYDILKKIQNRSRFPQVCYIIVSSIDAFRLTYKETSGLLEVGRQTAMETGEFEMGFVIWHCMLGNAVVSGQSIETTMSMTQSILQQTELYQVHSIGTVVKRLLPWMQRLAGQLPLDWNALSQSITEVVPSDIAAGSEYFYAIHYQVRAVLAILFSKYAQAEKILRQYVKATSQDDSYHLAASRLFLGGIVAAGRYRQCKKRKYLRELTSKIKGLATILNKKGNNVLHHNLLLQAEAKSLKKKRPLSVKKAYDIAILMANEVGCVQDAALGCELAGEHFLRTDNHVLIGDYFTRAVVFYQRWGCTTKVRDLEARRQIYIDTTKTNQGNDQHGRNAHPEFSILIPTLCVPSHKYSEDPTSTTRSACLSKVASLFTQPNSYPQQEEEDGISVLSCGSFR